MILRERKSPGEGNSMSLSASDTNPKRQRGRVRPRWRFGFVRGVLVNPGGLPTEFATRRLGVLLFYQGGLPTELHLGHQPEAQAKDRQAVRMDAFPSLALPTGIGVANLKETMGDPVADLYQKSGVCIRLTTMGTNATCLNTRSCRNSNRRKSAKNWLVNVYHATA
jgi:hypothetical protein